MLKLRTTVDVTHTDVSKILTGGTKSGVVSMEILGFDLKSNEGIRIPFRYLDQDGNELPTIYKGLFNLDSSSLIGLSGSINALLPDDDNLIERIWNEIRIIAVGQMSESFSILPSQIEEYE